MQQPTFYLGCPVWSCSRWRGSVYPSKAPQRDWLKYYSQTFNTVECNSSFYAIPTQETVSRWADQVEPGFRLALKFPQVITHQKSLKDVQNETDLFLQCVEILHSRRCLGPTFLQFPERFGPDRLAELHRYIRSLPSDYSYAVELRNKAFFAEPVARQLDEMLAELKVDRVVLDSRPLNASSPNDNSEQESQARKPRLPVLTHAVGPHPFLRIIGRNDVSLLDPWIQQWTPVIVNWVGEGRVPYVFTHTPSDRFAPEFAQRFYRSLAARIPGMASELKFPYQSDEQLELFS